MRGDIFQLRIATIIVIIVVLFISHVIIKYQYGFWYYQPVQHTWRYLRPWRWSSMPAVIRPELPSIATAAPGCLVLVPKILTTTYADLLDIGQWNMFTDLIAGHYLNRADGNVYTPTLQNIRPHFIGHNDPCFISFFHHPIEDAASAVGAMTSRPLLATFSPDIRLSPDNLKDVHLSLDCASTIHLSSDAIYSIHLSLDCASTIRLSSDAINSIRLYYVDFLCVDKMWRKQGIASKLIQTHEYHQRHKNRAIQVSLFKHETDVLKGVVPLVSYTTYGFILDSGAIAPPQPIPPYKMSTITKATMPAFMDFLNTARPTHRAFIAPAIANVLELIDTQNLYIHTVIDMNTKNPIAAYFYKNTCVQWDTAVPNSKVLMLAASLRCPGIDDALFIRGFFCSHYAIRKKHPAFGVCGIEAIGSNTVITRHLLDDIGLAPLVTSPTAYFLYNYLHPIVTNDAAFILC